MSRKPSAAMIISWIVVALSCIVVFICTDDDGRSFIRGSDWVEFFARTWVMIGPGIAIWLAIVVNKQAETQRKLWELESKYSEATGEWP